MTIQKKYGVIGMFERFGIREDLDYLTENLGLLLSAGVDVAGALLSIEESVRTKNMKRILRRIQDDIASGLSLSNAFERAKIFPARVLALIRTGEQSGQLAKNFKMLAEQEEKQRAFKSKIRSALMYPGFVFGVTITVGIGISWFILPRLATLFTQLKVKLPILTEWLLAFGTFLGKHGTIVVPMLLATLAFIIYFLFFFKKTRFIGENILYEIPGVNRLLREVEIARFGSLLGGLLKSGIPISDALNSLTDSTESVRYKKLYTHLRGELLRGESLEKGLGTFPHSSGLIPAPIQQLIITGSKSGNLADTLVKTGSIFEEKSDTTMKNLGIILEPILLFLVWIGVVAVALAVILPIYGLIGGINR